MEALEFLNEKIREEHGNKVTIESKWTDTGLDSFGTTMVLADMDNEYGCFPKEWFTTVDWEALKVSDILDKVQNESTKL